MSVDYTEFDNYLADNTNYNYEPIDVTTSDGYILTLFHLWLDDGMDTDLAPVFFQHGLYMNALYWIQDSIEYGDGNPTIFDEFLNKGHHVYVGNNRGTEWSLGHTSLDYTNSADQEAYWDFTWGDMDKDVIANGEAMKTNFEALGGTE